MPNPIDPRFRMTVGIEDTFVIQEGPGARSLEEYELTQHYANWRGDLALAAESGATSIRYGLPWYRVNPERGRFEWDWADEVINTLVNSGLEVILDLVHYGTPEWLEDGFAHPEYPERVAEYAAALAERYGDRVAAWTPLNEPQWTARLCGESATWPPALSGDTGYVTIMASICRGISLTQAAVIAASSQQPTFVHVEASFRYDRERGVESAEADLLELRRFLSLDLLTGRVTSEHPLVDYLLSNGLAEADLEWFRAHPAVPDILGVNYYPMWSTFNYAVGADGIRGAERDDGVDGLVDVLRTYSARYDLPVMITETSFEGSVEQQVEWLEESVAAINTLRDDVPVVGYTWWPFFDQVKWQYREGTEPVEDYLHHLGLVSLTPDDDGSLRRTKTPAFDVFKTLALAERSERDRAS